MLRLDTTEQADRSKLLHVITNHGAQLGADVCELDFFRRSTEAADAPVRTARLTALVQSRHALLSRVKVLGRSHATQGSTDVTELGALQKLYLDLKAYNARLAGEKFTRLWFDAAAGRFERSMVDGEEGGAHLREAAAVLGVLGYPSFELARLELERHPVRDHTYSRNSVSKAPRSRCRTER